MKLVRFGEAGRERPGLIDEAGIRRDVSSVVSDWEGMWLDPDALGQVCSRPLESYPQVDSAVRWGPCVAGTRKIVCIGLNYADHAAETGTSVPEEPVVFLKACAPSGPYDDLMLPRGSSKTDWEVELGLVIGRRAVYVTEAEALSHVVGYCVCNDYSERAWQLEGTGTWDKGKGCDGFGPIGPWLATKDEIDNLAALALWLDVNGERMQSSSTAEMVHRPASLVSYVSRFMSLLPGDIISTGTPPGVGLGRKPQRFLKAGDVVELGIEQLGSQRQRILEAT